MKKNIEKKQPRDGIPVVVWLQRKTVIDIDRAARGNRSYWIREAIENKLKNKLK